MYYLFTNFIYIFGINYLVNKRKRIPKGKSSKVDNPEKLAT